ncbi:MAG: hypothetical protein Q4B48_00785 [Syntrophomonadaceae bacterium]|nr:hypothetical protein [Syntrophomonadaceae bacterium]
MTRKRIFAILLFAIGVGYLIFAIATGFTIIDFVLFFLLLVNGAVVWIADVYNKRALEEEEAEQAAAGPDDEPDPTT